MINYINNMKYIEGTIFTKCYNNEESRRNLNFKLLNNGDDFRLYSEDYPFIPLNPLKEKYLQVIYLKIILVQ